MQMSQLFSHNLGSLKIINIINLTVAGERPNILAWISLLGTSYGIRTFWAVEWKM